ncbi:MAG: DNA repair and recombination protein RadB [Nanoarchaeota archaeon]
MVLSRNSKKISTGSYDFNTWLCGGYETDVISMIAGPPGSGKTNFSILAACSQARKNNKVLFIDTEGGFSVERVKQIVGEDKLDRILSNILVLQPTSFSEQKQTFEKLQSKIKTGHIGLIVIDGMAMLYRLELGDAIKTKDDEKIREVNREVAKQMRTLAEISRKQKIPILITNQVYKDFVKRDESANNNKDNQVEMQKFNIVGGDLFKYWSKCIIQLENGILGKKKARLLKHRSLPEKEIGFVIKDKGLFKKGLI